MGEFARGTLGVKWFPALVFKLGHSRPLFHLFLVFSNELYNFTTNKCLKCQVHPVYGARI